MYKMAMHVMFKLNRITCGNVLTQNYKMEQNIMGIKHIMFVVYEFHSYI